MRRVISGIVLACALAVTGEVRAAMPALPDGARTRWVVGDAEEIVAYLVFDPDAVARRLPPFLRFVTVGELAAGGVPWAVDHLALHPAHGRWGVSFLEIVRMRTFTLDGRAPRWPADGAAALWCARVAPANPATDLGPGRPLLVLDFWMPDRAYAAYMRRRGHHATFGDVRLRRGPEGTRQGSIAVAGLRVDAGCTPTGPIAGGPGSAAMQVLFPTRSSPAAQVVRVAFAGHREQACVPGVSWSIDGTHPLAGAVVVGGTSLQFGYDLVGGAYRR